MNKAPPWWGFFIAHFSRALDHPACLLVKQYEGQVDVLAVFKSHSTDLNAQNQKHSVTDFLEMLEGSLARSLGKASKQEDKKALNVEKENQLVVHDKGLEKEKGHLQGNAERIESIPKDTVVYKPEGKYTIEQADNFEFPIGTRVQLEFKGIYHGKPTRFTGIFVEVVSPPIIREGHKYAGVKFPYTQEVFIESINKSVYFSIKTKNFHIQIK